MVFHSEPLFGHRNTRPGLKFSSEKENFKPKMTISIENGSFPPMGESSPNVFFRLSSENVYFFDLWALWERQKLCTFQTALQSGGFKQGISKQGGNDICVATGMTIPQRNPCVRKIFCPQFWGREWLRQFYGRLEKCVLSAGKPHAHKIPRLTEGGGYFGFFFWGGGEVWAREIGTICPLGAFFPCFIAIFGPI